MFNLWPKNEVREIIDNMPKFAWKVGPSFYIDDKEYTIGELVDYIKNLLKENKDLNDVLKSIEEDGTEEHNNAIKLREENAELKIEIDRLNERVNRLIEDGTNVCVENARLMERVNEIDSDMNEEYRAEVFLLKNDIAVLKAKYQILEHNYQGCIKYRDEYKHQLNAANKEIDALKTKHPMYPLHWGGVSNLFQKAKDLTEGVEVDLDKSLDEQCDEVKKSQNWSTLKIAMEDAVQTKQREVYGVEKPVFLSCACGDCYEKIKQYNKQNEKCPTWEEAASDLALRVTKLEEQLKYIQKISFTE